MRLSKFCDAWKTPVTAMALASALLPFLSGCSKTQPAAAQKTLVQTAAVEPLTDTRQNSAPEYMASVRADAETDFSFKVGGIVELIGPDADHGWDEGTPVKTGTPLARLKQGDFINAVTSAKARAELTETTYERFSRLRKTDAISQQELDAAKADAETAKAQLSEAQQNLEDSELRAPWDGVVLSRFINARETASPGKPVLRFANIQVMSVELGVPDRVVGHFAAGKMIQVDVSALQGHPPFDGKVTEVGVAASRDGRLFRVVIKVPNPDGLIRSGMTATVRVEDDVAAAPPGSVLVPLSALVMAPGSGGGATNAQSQLAVFVTSGGKAAMRKVRTGDIIESSIVISDGLKAGEEVVTKGASLLYDGAPIEILQTQAVGN